MGATSIRSRHWLWPAFILVVLTIALAGRGARASIDDTAAVGTSHLPYISKPKPPQLELVPFVTGENKPEFDNVTITVITHAGDERLFVANREGRVWIVFPDGSISDEPFLNVTNKLQYDRNFEQGFLGLAFHPDYPATPYFYFTYTTPGDIQIARGEVSSTDPNRADPSSIRTLITMHKSEIPDTNILSPVHNAGDLAFGPDGYLYIPVGDGGPDPYETPLLPGDPHNNSQRRDKLLGKILRIDPDPARGLPPDCGGNLYSIPPSNPWLNDNGCDELWVTGLRNPWRFAIDSLTGDFYFADVGEWRREEVNFLPAGTPGGVNFGWHCWEGTVNYSTVWPAVGQTCNYSMEYEPPVHEYDHSQGECSVIGGKVYRGSRYPSLYGRYIFGDWCSGRIWTMMRQNGEWKVDPAGVLPQRYTTFGEDIHGELYAGTYLSGTLYKVVVR